MQRRIVRPRHRVVQIVRRPGAGQDVGPPQPVADQLLDRLGLAYLAQAAPEPIRVQMAGVPPPNGNGAADAEPVNVNPGGNGDTDANVNPPPMYPLRGPCIVGNKRGWPTSQREEFEDEDELPTHQRRLVITSDDELSEDDEEPGEVVEEIRREALMDLIRDFRRIVPAEPVGNGAPQMMVFGLARGEDNQWRLQMGNEMEDLLIQQAGQGRVEVEGEVRFIQPVPAEERVERERELADILIQHGPGQGQVEREEEELEEDFDSDFEEL